MTRTLFGIAVALVAMTLTAAHARAQGAEGKWKVSYVLQGVNENTIAIVKVKIDGGKVAAEMLAGTPRFKDFSFKSATQTDNTLRVAFQAGSTDLVFEAQVPKDATKTVRGVMAVGETLYPGLLTATEETTLDAKSSFRLVECPPMQQARTLNQSALLLQARAAQKVDPKTKKAVDSEMKKALAKQAAEAAKKAKAESPGLYREVVAKHADSPATLEAAMNLIKSAKTSDASKEAIKNWADTGARLAKTFGSRFETDYNAQIATALLVTDDMEKLAVEYARRAEKALTPQSPEADQVKALNVLIRALRKTGANDEATPISARVEKLDLILDKRYEAKYPGFTGTKFTGRKSQSDRAVFMELFTGAMCPPCVAADLAFDVLQKTYKPSELVLIQYHMHIPGPDPMTNPDTEARWDFYKKSFADQVRGVPCSIFNGKPAEKPAQSGGGFADAEDKYGAYVDVINPLLEENAGAKLNVEARRDGDRIDIAVKVSGLANTEGDKRLRILVAEETVRYAGSNRIRYHHNVVRAFPGGVDGLPLKEAAARHKTSINLSNLRTDLTKYLDNFEATKRAFTNPARPLAFDNLRVIAFVQDDATRGILQAVQVELDKK